MRRNITFAVRPAYDFISANFIIEVPPTKFLIMLTLLFPFYIFTPEQGEKYDQQI